MELDDGDSSDNPPLPEDSPVISQFIENMGLHYQHYGLSRISGRILGLLLVTPQPISSEEMAEALQVSRSSVSTNLRTLLMTGLIEKVSLPGNRVDFFTLTPGLVAKGSRTAHGSHYAFKDDRRAGPDKPAASAPGARSNGRDDQVGRPGR
jgi:DNA-binding transcriptional ArsR family regulator